MHKVLVNRLGGLSLPRNSVVRLTDRPDMTLDVYRGRKTRTQHLTNIIIKVSMLLDQHEDHNTKIKGSSAVYSPLLNNFLRSSIICCLMFSLTSSVFMSTCHAAAN